MAVIEGLSQLSSIVAKLAASGSPPFVLPTEPITIARRIVKAHVAQWLPDATTSAASIIAVQGDYGSGKTFLLQDAIRTTRRELQGANASASESRGDEVPTSVEPTVLLAPCVGGNAVSWYRQTFGQTFGSASKGSSSLRALMLQLYVDAAKTVAAKLPLTEAAVDKLNADPAAVFRLLNEHLLSRTAVDEVVSELLVDIAPDQTVSACLKALVWSETDGVARKWLGAERLTASELDILRVATGLDSSALVAEVIVAVARLHTRYRRPLAIFIDELEHFVRYDSRRPDGESNVTWLKRLLESLAATSTLVFVAGHWDAWAGMKSDSLDRFSPREPIITWRLGELDIIALVRLVRPKADAPDPATASTIGKITGGNFRQVLRLVYQLRAQTSADAKLDPVTVERVSEELGLKLTIDRAIPRIEQMLEQRGLNVERECVVDTIQFDLVGSLGGRPKVVVEFRDAVSPDGVAVVGDVQRFIAKFEHVAEAGPGLVGIFISDIGIGSEISDLLAKKAVNCLAFDLMRHDFIAALERELDIRLGVPRGAGAATAMEQFTAQGAALLDRIDEVRVAGEAPAYQREAHREDVPQRVAEIAGNKRQQERDLDTELAAIESRRIAEAAELRARIDALTATLTSEREREVTRLVRPADQLQQILHVTYADLAKPTPLSSRFMRSIYIYYVFLAVVASGLLTIASFGNSICRNQLCFDVTIALVPSAIFILSIAIWLVFQRNGDFQKFDDMRIRLLREIYVRAESPDLLIQADNQMRAALARDGPRRATNKARDIVDTLFQSRDTIHTRVPWGYG